MITRNTTNINVLKEYLAKMIMSKNPIIDSSNKVLTTKKIYLDTNFWIKLRNAPKNGKEDDKLLLQIITEKVQKERCILPVSETMIWEAYKQKDPATLTETTTLMDKFSKGVCITTLQERRKLEFANFVLSSQGKSTLKHEEWIWTALSKEPYSRTETDRSEHQDTSNTSENAHSLTEAVEHMIHTGTFVPFSHKDNIELLNWAKNRYKDQNKTFNEMFLSELYGYIDLFDDDFDDVMNQLYVEETGSLLKNDDNIHKHRIKWSRVIYNLYKQGKLSNQFPSITVYSELCAAARWNKHRKYTDGNDMIDFIHATTALPYFDYFFTEKELTTIIKQRKLDQRHNCQVESSTKNVIDVLSQL